MPDKQSETAGRRVCRVAERGALARSSSMLVGEPTEVWPQAGSEANERPKPRLGAKPGLPTAAGGRARCFGKLDLAGPRLTAGQLGRGSTVAPKAKHWATWKSALPARRSRPEGVAVGQVGGPTKHA